MVCAQPRIRQNKWNAQNSQGFWDKKRQLDLLIVTPPKKGRIMEFAVSTDHRVKQIKSEKSDKYLDFARELKKLLNMKVTVMPIVVGELSTVIKRLVQGL